jgi:hypothetical protein
MFAGLSGFSGKAMKQMLDAIMVITTAPGKKVRLDDVQ